MKEGVLFNEFDRIFSDVFNRRAATYKKIVASLVSGPKTLSDISKTTDTVRSGQQPKYLNDLVESGFIWKDKVFSLKTGKELRSAKFRLKDNYLRFYLKYIEPLADNIRRSIICLSPFFFTLYTLGLRPSSISNPIDQLQCEAGMW